MHKYTANLFALSAMITLFFGCRKSGEMEPPVNPLPQAVLKIPVVVHVLYDEDKYNITDEKILSQIAVLNKDFRKLNTDIGQLPAQYTSLAADVAIEFALAKTGPDGRATNGITRKFTTVDGTNGRTGQNMDKPASELALYHSSQGGADLWPTDKYLNIYVAVLTSRTGDVALPGYAQLPGKDPQTDAVVIDPRCFGTVEPLKRGYHLGRTATHEIGHWLDLKHVFEETDLVDDTPPGGMEFNFMNYDTDDKLLMFTHGQKERMRAVFNIEGKRRLLYNNITRLK